MKRKLGLILATTSMLILLMISMTITASAEDIVRSGTWGDLSWSLNETTGELTISGEGSMSSFTAYSSTAWRAYTSKIKSIKIGDSVTSIANYAFKSCTSLTSVTIGNSVTSIGSDAFSGCNSLTSITIPDSVTSIASSAFSGCSSLESITLPFVGGSAKRASDTYQYPFGYIFGTSSYTGGVETKQYYYGSSISKTTYNNYYIPESLKSVTITGGDILYGAFYNCSNLTSITFSNSVTSIGSEVFYNCSALTNVTIGDSVTSIASKAFYNCSALTSVTIGDSVTSIGSDAFAGCKNLADVYITDVEAWLNISFGNNLAHPNYYGNLHILGESGIGINELTIPDSVTSIGSYAFYNCTSLTSITIPASITIIGDVAFYGCNNLADVYITDVMAWLKISCSAYTKRPNYYGKLHILGESGSEITELTIPDSVTKIGNYVFSNCSALTSITIPDKVTSIGDYAFSGCSSLTGITIPDKVTSIGHYAFSGCSIFTSITIPDSVTNIGNSAFSGCSSLTSMTIPFVGASKNGTSNDHFGYIFGTSYSHANASCVPASLKTVVITGGTSIGYEAFYGCSSLTSITIPDSVTSIGNSAFSGCNSLTSITIPDDVTSIGNYVFSNCSALTSITIPARVTSIGIYAFYNCSALTSVTMGDYVRSIGEHAFQNCTSLTSVTIGDCETSIGEYAFQNCTSLTSMTISDYATSIGFSAFSGCSSLESITLPFVGGSEKAASSTYQYPFGYIFGSSSYTGGVATKQYYYGNRSTSSNELTTTNSTYYIPESLKSVTITGGNILYGAFYNCSNLTSITLSDNVTSIDNSAFSKCTSLTSITIPDNVTSIGSYTFQNCTSLTSITIPDNVTSIGNYAFSNCSALTSVTIGDSVTSIGSYTFQNCTSLTSITIPDNVTRIGDSAFSGCNSLESITLPFVGGSAKTASSTYQYPFGYIFGESSYTGGVGTSQYYYGSSTGSTTSSYYYIPESLKSVTINGGNILYGAFYNCSNLTSITLPTGITSIPNSAFHGCVNLIQTENGVSYVDKWVIDCDESVTSVELRANTVGINFNAFYNCSALASITIPDSVMSIGNSAFFNCSALSSVIIGDSVMSIGNSAFQKCSALTSVTIGDNVTSIGFATFLGCSSLESITLPFVGGSAKKASDTYQYPFGYIFGESSYTGGVRTSQYYYGSSTGSTTSSYYYIPESLKSVTITGGNILHGAFYNCSNLTSITLTNGVASIASSAFSGCSSLESITLPFVGGSAKKASDTYQYPFGYIFGTGNYTGSVSTEQYYYGSSTSRPTHDTYYIPSTLKSVTITGRNIPYGAFYNCSNLTSITFTDSVTSIGFNAFYGCVSLIQTENGVSYMDKWVIDCDDSVTSVELRTNTVGIGSYAFSDCIGLTSIEIPDTVVSISDYAFQNCSALTSITILDNVTNIGFATFSGCSSLESITLPFVGGSAKKESDTTQYPFGYIFGTNSYTGGVPTSQYYASTSGTINSYYIPSNLKSVTIIGGNIHHRAFYNCSNLTSITLSDSVTNIGLDAFYNCSALTSVTIGDNVTSIGSEAFYNCSALTSVTIGDNVTSIDSGAFSGCSSLTSITIPDSVTSIGGEAFRSCSSLTTVTIGSGVMSIGDSAFYDCYPNNVYITDVEAWLSISFANSNARPNRYGSKLHILDENGIEITELTIPNSVTRIDESAFYNCTSLTSITISDNVTSIGDYAFYNCDSLTSVTIGDSVTSIGDHAFFSCASLTSVTIGDSVTSIGSNAFCYCFALTSITIPDSVTSIGAHAFRNCSKLTDITFGEDSQLTSIGISVFCDCGNLTSIAIPEGVTSIGWSAFENCTSLTSVTIGGDSVTSIGSDAFYNCTSLTSITIPANVTSIGSDAFQNCRKLLEVINLSALEIVKGDTSYGYVAYYAMEVHNSESKLVNLDGYVFYPYNGVNYLVSYTGTDTDLVLPANYNGQNYEIYKYAFYGNNNITSITIPETVYKIHQYAFGEMKNLQRVTFAENCICTEIGESAFYGCNNMVNFTIPDHVRTIGASAFYNCYNLTSVTVGSSVTSINSYAFQNCYKLAEVINKSNLNIWASSGSSSYGYIGAYAIEVHNGESKLINQNGYLFYPFGSGFLVNYVGSDTELALPADCGGYTTYAIWNYAFYENDNITSAVIPKDVVSIGYYAFAYCDNLESVTMGDGLASIQSYAFAYNDKLTNITFGEGFPGLGLSIGSYAFYDCDGLVSIELPSTTSSIGSSAFNSCDKLEHITIGDGATSIGYEAFGYCSALKSIKIGANITSIGSNAFANCTNLKIIYVNSPTIAGELTYATACGSLIRNAEVILVEKSITNPADFIISTFFYSEELNYEGTDYISYALHTHIWEDCSVERVQCERDGFDGSKCTSCGLLKGNTNPAHAYTPHSANDNEYHWDVCANCGAIDNKIRHFGNSGEITTPATHISTGVMTYTCGVCSKIYTETIEKVAEHNYGEWIETVAPGCSTTGILAHYHCECGLDFDAEKNVLADLTIPMRGHYVSQIGKEMVDSYTEKNDAIYPFTPTTGWYASSNHTHSTTSTFEINAIYDCTLVLKYTVSSERSCDKLTIRHNATTKDAISGNISEKTITLTLKAGDIVYITYTKDGSSSSGTDTGLFKIESCTQTEIDTTVYVSTDDVDPTCTGAVICESCHQTIKAALGHINSETVVENRVEPNCTTNGSYDNVVYCSVCSAEVSRETKIIDKLGHNYETEWTVDVAPACTTVGSKSYHCSRCSDKANVTEIPATGHSYGDWYETKAPTCTVTGTDEHECSVCHNKETRTVDALGHNHSTEWTVDTAPTCTTAGSKSHHCSRCSDKADVTEIPATGHSYGDWYETKAPTCTATGTDEHECSVCHNKETRTVDALGHNHSAEWTVDTAPTCTTVGSKSHHCSRCSDKADITELPATGHSYGDWYETKAPTCTATGTDEHECSVCHNKEARMTDAKGHTNAEAVVENKVDSNCTTDGSYDSVVYCSVCNEQISRETKIIDKLGHDYETEWTVDVAPACTTVGSKSHHCSRCDDKANVTEIPANGHTDAVPVVENSVDATCTTNGHYDSVVYCSSCNKELSREQKIVSMKNHIEVVDTAVAPTCTTTGLTEGKHCSACDEILVAQNEIAMVDHNYGDWIVTKQETTTEDGIREKICSICGDKITTFIPATGEEVTNPDSDNATPPKEEDKNDNATELSGSAVAAIVISSVAVAGGGGFSLFWFVIKKKSASNLLMVLKGSASKSLAVLKESTSKLLSVLRKK